MRIAIFTDAHISDKKNDEIRFYEKSSAKVQTLFSYLKTMDVNKIFCLGDLFDSLDDSWLEQEMLRLSDSLAGLGLPFALTLGNHDALSGLYNRINAEFNPEGNQDGYFVLQDGGYNFIFLNTNYDSAGVHYDQGVVNDLDLNISEKQLQFLEKELKTRQIPTVILSHARIMSDPQADGEAYLINNAERVVNLLDAYSQVILVIQGHAHKKEEYCYKGINYISLPALIDGETALPFIIGDFSSQSIKLFYYDTNDFAQIEWRETIEIPFVSNI